MSFFFWLNLYYFRYGVSIILGLGQLPRTHGLNVYYFRDGENV